MFFTKPQHVKTVVNHFTWQIRDYITKMTDISSYVCDTAFLLAVIWVESQWYSSELSVVPPLWSEISQTLPL